MRFNGLDLNLLVALDVLLTERNVSRAGERLCLSQSATSGALARLREYFGDELLVPLGRQMVLTPRARGLADAVRGVLLQIQGQVLRPPGFDPATSTRTFTIMASDYVAVVALSHALARITEVAPGMRFEIVPLEESPAEALGCGAVDLLIWPDRWLSRDHPSEVLFSDAYLCLVDANNPDVGETLTFEGYLRLGHVVVHFASNRQPALEDWFIGRFGHVRRAEVAVSDYTAAPYLVAGTRRIATVHGRLARIAARALPLRLVPPPFDIPGITEVVQWHRMNDKDEALAWVRGMIEAAVRSDPLASDGDRVPLRLAASARA